MNNLYRRIVTMGMISFSAILAWVYCILAYSEKTVYVVCLSLVLIISLYALLSGIVKLHLAKQEELKRYISDTVNATVANIIPDPAAKQAELDQAIEAERLAKATYVQLRKVNNNLTSLTEANSYNSVKNIDNYTAVTLSLKDALTQSINKTAKVLVKYNKTDSQDVIDAIKQLNKEIQDINGALETISTRIDNINIVAQPHTKTVLEDSVMDDTLPEGLDVFSITTNTPEDTASVEETAVNSFFDEFETKTEEAEKVEEPVVEEAPEAVTEPVDPNKPLSPEEIAALFNASKEERTAKSEEDFDKDNLPEAMDQNLIDALLNNLDTEEAKTPEEDKIIQFPVTEEPKTEEPEIAEEFDPNKQLSADEIAALFASINGGN